MSEELKPCPFCGGVDVNLRQHLATNMSWVSCTECGLEAPSETGWTDDIAIEYWNTRSDAAKDAEIERLRNLNNDAHAIIDRIWSIFGTPSYEQLNGQTIYDLVQHAVDQKTAAARLRNKVPARALTDGQLSDEIAAVDAVCAGGFGEGSGSPGEWWCERADELEHERKRRDIEAQLSAHNADALKGDAA